MTQFQPGVDDLPTRTLDVSAPRACVSSSAASHSCPPAQPARTHMAMLATWKIGRRRNRIATTTTTTWGDNAGQSSVPSEGEPPIPAGAQHKHRETGYVRLEIQDVRASNGEIYPACDTTVRSFIPRTHSGFGRGAPAANDASSSEEPHTTHFTFSLLPTY